MIFIEFRTFSRARADLLDDEDFRALQDALMQNPEAGAVIQGTGGLRKLRWFTSGRGKRGGVRVIYFPLLSNHRVLLLLLYAKNEQDDLTAEQKRILRSVVQAEIAARQG